MANTTIEIRVNITNGSSNISTAEYPLNTPLHIELHPSELYGIVDEYRSPKLIYRYASSGMGADSELFSRSEDSDTWVLDTNLQFYYAATDDMYCTVTYEYERKYARIKNNIIQCTSDFPDGLYTLTEHTITIRADDNCEFHVAPKISYYAYDESSLPWEWRYFDQEFNRVSESEYTVTLTFNSDNEIYTVSAEAVEKTDVTDKYGLIAVYKPDKEILVALSKVRFAVPKSTTVDVEHAHLTVVNDEYIDTVKYAISLRKMYFKINTRITENICLGPYNTTIPCPVIGTDIIKLDMGTIAITGRHQNIMDYKNTDMQIYLPFAGFIELEPADFMDKSISLRYEVNVINGDALAVISADDNVMKIVNCNASFPIPYRLNDRENVVTTMEPNTNYLLQEKPFIYIKSYNAAVPDTKMPYNDTKFYAKFADVHGYTQATEIDYVVVHDYITKTEIDEIISLLQNGVFL